MILEVASQKGGVGKTTVAAHLIYYAHQVKNLRVLGVDADTQGNLTTTLQSDLSFLVRPGGSETLFHSESVAGLDVTPIAEGLDLLHGHQNLDPVDRLDLKQVVARLQALRTDLLTRWDVIVIDTPPSIGLRQIAPLTIADRALIVFQPERFALNGLALTLNSVKMARNVNPKLRADAVVNKFKHLRSHREVLAEVQRDLEPLKPYLREREAVAQAIASDPPRPVWKLRGASRDTKQDWLQLMASLIPLPERPHA